MDKQVKCPHCGGTTYRLLQQPRNVECQDCGRSFLIDQAQQQSAPTEKQKRPE